MAEAVTREDVLRVAELANLELTADEVPRMARDLSAILGHIVQLSELDTSSVRPMAAIADVLADVLNPDVLDPARGRAPNSAHANLRPDEIRASLDRKTVMSQAPDTDGRFFKVPKVLER